LETVHKIQLHVLDQYSLSNSAIPLSITLSNTLFVP